MWGFLRDVRWSPALNLVSGNQFPIPALLTCWVTRDYDTQNMWAAGQTLFNFDFPAPIDVYVPCKLHWPIAHFWLTRPQYDDHLGIFYRPYDVPTVTLLIPNPRRSLDVRKSFRLEHACEYAELKAADFSLILKFMSLRAESSASHKDIPNWAISSGSCSQTGPTLGYVTLISCVRVLRTFAKASWDDPSALVSAMDAGPGDGTDLCTATP